MKIEQDILLNIQKHFNNDNLYWIKISLKHPLIYHSVLHGPIITYLPMPI